ncbi:MAG: DUF2922 domain-containing protein [Selenomonas sp.]|uniref:DUF2922 family protein n=1 Tax=Selenomonas sp. TaxID=2053611 RepID=UPI0025E6EC51|nr:DUF2922 family protein [Selenomonas sp.]MCR5438124.1 DUF2922 domain-containing protein [Selenomonas sp.]
MKEKTLFIIFNRSDGKTAELTIPAPRDDLKRADIYNFVTKVRSTKFFLINGKRLVSLNKAFIRTVSDDEITQ